MASILPEDYKKSSLYMWPLTFIAVVLYMEYGLRVTLLYIAAVACMGMVYNSNTAVTTDSTVRAQKKAGDVIATGRLPQETPVEVLSSLESLDDGKPLLLAQDAILSSALDGLADLKVGRPSVLELTRASLESFLRLHASLMSRKVPGPGNTRVHARAHHQISSMSHLRGQIMQNLSTGIFELRSSSLTRKATKAMSRIRDRLHDMYTTCVVRWRPALPALGNGAPPFESMLSSSTDKYVLYPA